MFGQAEISSRQVDANNKLDTLENSSEQEGGKGPASNQLQSAAQSAVVTAARQAAGYPLLPLRDESSNSRKAHVMKSTLDCKETRHYPLKL